MHQTNKAFERYFRVGTDDVRDIYKLTREDILCQTKHKWQKATSLVVFFVCF